MTWWQRLLRRFVEPEVKTEWRVRSDTVFLPLGQRVTRKEYLEACQRLMTTNDGRALLAAYRDKMVGAFQMVCPYPESERRLAWLAGHEVLLAVRKEMCDELEKNVELLDDEEPIPQRLRGLRTREGAE